MAKIRLWVSTHRDFEKKKNGEKEMWRKIGNVVYGLLLVLLILTLSGYLLLTGV